LVLFEFGPVSYIFCKDKELRRIFKTNCRLQRLALTSNRLALTSNRIANVLAVGGAEARTNTHKREAGR
jgi:hypothetical protein